MMPSLVRLKHRTHTDQHEQIYCTALTASSPAHLQCCEKGPPRVGEATGYAGPRRRRETHGEGPEGQDESIRGEHLARHPRNPGCPPYELQRHCSTPERSPRPTVAVEACSTLDRSHEPRTVGSHCEQNTNSSRVADRDLPARVRAALARTALRNLPHYQSVGGARSRRDDRRCHRQ